jgi:hypothetical protein
MFPIAVHQSSKDVNADPFVFGGRCGATRLKMLFQMVKLYRHWVMCKLVSSWSDIAHILFWFGHSYLIRRSMVQIRLWNSSHEKNLHFGAPRRAKSSFPWVRWVSQKIVPRKHKLKCTVSVLCGSVDPDDGVHANFLRSRIPKPHSNFGRQAFDQATLHFPPAIWSVPVQRNLLRRLSISSMIWARAFSAERYYTG